MSHVDEKILAALENAKRCAQEAENWDKQLDEIIVEIKSEMVANLSMEMEQRSFFATSPSSKILDKGDFKKEDNPLVAYYCFDSYAIGGLMYNLIFVTLLGEAILIVSINCTMKDIEKYKLLFYGIMHTASIEREA